MCITCSQDPTNQSGREKLHQSDFFIYESASDHGYHSSLMARIAHGAAPAFLVEHEYLRGKSPSKSYGI